MPYGVVGRDPVDRRAMVFVAAGARDRRWTTASATRVDRSSHSRKVRTHDRSLAVRRHLDLQTDLLETGGRVASLSRAERNADANNFRRAKRSF